MNIHTLCDQRFVTGKNLENYDKWFSKCAWLHCLVTKCAISVTL